MKVSKGDTVIVPGGKTWEGQRGKLLTDQGEIVKVLLDDDRVLDVFAFDISLPESVKSGPRFCGKYR
jgi:hypothetical protein